MLRQGAQTQVRKLMEAEYRINKKYQTGGVNMVYMRHPVG